jgi:hypothetical protein
VAESHRTSEGVIIRDARITELSVGEAHPDGLLVRFDDVFMRYHLDFAAGDTEHVSPDVSVGCSIAVSQVTVGHWRVVEETCNTSF